MQQDFGFLDSDPCDVFCERQASGFLEELAEVVGAGVDGPGHLAQRQFLSLVLQDEFLGAGNDPRFSVFLVHQHLVADDGQVLGENARQAGSLVAPDRLRFDFSHPRPMTPEELRTVEEQVNRAILADQDVYYEYLGYPEAVARGAMALFGEKYGDVVRLVSVPGVSMELCGGTHVTHTGEIGLFRIVSESGIASGVRRIEAVTGSVAYERASAQDEVIKTAAATLKTAPDQLLRRIEQLAEENRSLQREVERLRTVGVADVVGDLLGKAAQVEGATVVATWVEMVTPDELRAMGDRLRERLGSGAAVLAARFPEKVALFAVVTDDLISKGVRADKLVREVAKITGGSGGGRPHMAQGGVGARDRTADRGHDRGGREDRVRRGRVHRELVRQGHRAARRGACGAPRAGNR